MIEMILLVPNMGSVSTFTCEVCGMELGTDKPYAARHEAVCREESRNRGFVRKVFGLRYQGNSVGPGDLEVERIEMDIEGEGF